ncbi:hypothetical protein V8C35DRAFT_327419 [Trichoderma chlorosporum]
MSLAHARPETIQELAEHNSDVPTNRSWTSSSGAEDLANDEGEASSRSALVKKYNKLAAKNGMRRLVAGDFDTHFQKLNGPSSPEKKSWFYRIFRGSSSQATPSTATPASRSAHKRSSSNLGSLMRSKADGPRTLDVTDMVRLTRKSVLSLAPAFSPYPLTIPTCIRATAHYLAQEPATEGLFRVSGSFKTVKALFTYYIDAGGSDLYICTTYQPDMPAFIPHRVHDVASLFKRTLSCLPNGILGSLSLFDALLAIHSHLQKPSEVPPQKQMRMCARLMALAIGSVESQMQRDVICAVFGLLSLVGHHTEQVSTRNEHGQPPPPTQHMSYRALGVIFGPLLIGDNNISNYEMKSSSPTSGLVLTPVPPKKQRKQKAKEPMPDIAEVQRLGVLNKVAEMLIANWQEVVRQMVALGTLFDERLALAQEQEQHANGYLAFFEAALANGTVNSGVSTVAGADDLPGPSHNAGSEHTTAGLKRTKSARSTRSLVSRQGSVKGKQPLAPQMSATVEERPQEEDHAGPSSSPEAYAGDVAGPSSFNSGTDTSPARPPF